MGVLLMLLTMVRVIAAFVLLLISIFTKKIWLRKFVFDLPDDAENPRLDICESYGIDHAFELILIGDEDRVLHKRNYFKLGEQTQSAGVKR